MKTIYDLELGDTFYYNNGVGRIFSKTLSTNAVISDFFLRTLEHGNVFLTEEDCQRSIDYDVALAKIQKFVSEFSDEPDTMSEIVFNSHPQEIGFYVIERNGYVTQASPLVFKTKNAHRVLKELPNEVKIVLGVE